ncbi:ABC transporter ATP-binding protein [Pseudarthrobacter sp. P1]|uniref:ABC transporter ATP-binding protein n=1 Tax=Pseudarthrobacter sp. P1 TaxID=3418418 RepID=UPI003CEB6087
MLSTAQVHVNGRHHTLLPATTLAAERGRLLLVQADGQDRRTALALALSGRLKPSSGTVALGHDGNIARLRRRSAIIDSPNVNEPERHLSVRSLVAEDLAMVPRKFRDRTRPTAWLVRQGHTDLVGKWVEELDSSTMLELLVELALANPEVELVVVDSPDRHTVDDSRWLPFLARLAEGADLAGRELLVVAVVGRIPDAWDGAVAHAGDAPPEPEPGEEPEPDAGPDPAAEPEPAAAVAPEPPALHDSPDSPDTTEQQER